MAVPSPADTNSPLADVEIISTRTVWPRVRALMQLPTLIPRAAFRLKHPGPLPCYRVTTV